MSGPIALSKFDEIEMKTECNITIYNVNEIPLFDSEGVSKSDTFKISMLRHGNNPNVDKSRYIKLITFDESDHVTLISNHEKFLKSVSRSPKISYADWPEINKGSKSILNIKSGRIL